MSKRNQNRRSQNTGQSRTSEYRVDPREWSPSTDVPTRDFGSQMRPPAWNGPHGPGEPAGWQSPQGPWQHEQSSFQGNRYGQPPSGSWSLSNTSAERGYGNTYDGNHFANREYGSGRQFGNGDTRGYRSRDFSSAEYSNTPDYGGQHAPPRGGSQSYSNDTYSYRNDSDHDHSRDMSCCGPHSGRGPKSYKRTDDRIEDDINERLARHGLIDATDVSVTVADGVVTLTGQVDDREAKRMAEDLVEDSMGVKQVNNQLRARSGKSATSRDEESPSYSSRSSRDEDGQSRGSRNESKRS